MKRYLAILALCTVTLLTCQTETSYASEVSDESYTEDSYTQDETFVDEVNGSGENKNSSAGDYSNGTPFEKGGKNTDEYDTWEVPAIIDSINTKITVEKSNTYHVKKEVHLYYNTMENKQVEMLIPLNNFVKSSSDKIENINVATDATMTGFKTKTEEKGMGVIITDGSLGKKYVDYTITYDYISRGDSERSGDIFAQDLVGFKDIPVCKLNFTIHMPEDYEQKDLYFADINGNKLNISQSKEGFDINGYSNEKIDNASVNMVLTIQNKYFKSTKSSGLFRFIVGILSLLCTGLVIFGFLLAGVSYYKYGMSEKPEIIQQKRQIKGISPVDMVVILTGGLTNENVMIYLLQLLNEGYIAIKDTMYKHQKNRRPENGYWIIKLKEYDGNDKNMKKFMDIIFEEKEKVRPVDLSNKIYDKINKMRMDILDNGIEGLWEISEIQKKLCLVIGVMTPAITCMILSLYNLDAYLSAGHIFSFLYGGIMTFAIAVSITKANDFIKKRNMMRGGIADTMTWIYVFGIMFVVIIFTGIINNKLFVKNYFLLTLAYVAEIILIYCSNNMRKRTEKGTQICGKILGLRSYLYELNDMDMRRIIVKDSTYLYDILPYAFALDVTTDGWLAQMDNCIIENPKWYLTELETEFSVDTFIHDWNAIVSVMLEKIKENENG